MIFRWEVLHFSENSLFLFFPAFFVNFLKYCLFLVDFCVFRLHLGSQKAPRALVPGRLGHPLFACFFAGASGGRFGSLQGRFLPAETLIFDDSYTFWEDFRN